MYESQDMSKSIIFARGELVQPPYDQYFTGTTYVNDLVSFESPLGCIIGNVTFAPSSRNHWHLHPGGQVLLVTGGCGWYQEEGQTARKLRAGDVVEILPNVKHWHGAAADSWFVHLAIETDFKGGPPHWFGPVSDDEYNKLPLSNAYAR